MLLGYFKKTLQDKDLMKQCLTIAIPLMLQQLIVASVNLIDNLMVGELGDVAVSAVSSANRYYSIAQMAINAIVVSSIIFLSQYNGADDREHMRQSFRFSIISSYLFVFIFFFFALFKSDFIIKFISDFKENKRNTLAFGLLLGGCLGNLYDRVIYGYVRDFIYFKFGTYSYPIFNIADIGIVIGTILLLYACLKGEEDGSRSIKRRKNR